jgi:hypothetical protein
MKASLHGRSCPSLTVPLSGPEQDYRVCLIALLSGGRCVHHLVECAMADCAFGKIAELPVAFTDIILNLRELLVF